MYCSKMSRFLFERLTLLLVGTLLMYLVMATLMKNSGMMADINLPVDETIVADIESRIGNKLQLTNYEKGLLGCIIPNKSIDIRFADIKGLHDTKKTLLDSVVKPLRKRSTCPLLAPPNGIILHGPPGTGKTMLAKALCKELDCPFINFSANVIENKLYGESSKILDALMTLAEKVQPCVVFIDEMDGFFSTRNSLDQAFVNNLKSLIFSKVDGISTSKNSIVFIGTTNRLDQIDPAMKRRMRCHVHVPLPDLAARLGILRAHVGAYTAEDVDLDKVAEQCKGLSGSDIYEFCKHAAHASSHSDPLKMTQSVMNSSIKYFVDSL